jgi:D-amino peptidase
MKILIAADMEGISGVTRWEETDPSNPDYGRFRKIMTDEVNAAIAGAIEGGATEIIVADGHNSGTNILVENLDKRAVLNSGNSSPFGMIQGVDLETSGVIFIGYHARAGTLFAILAHTWSSGRIANVWLNDILVGEYGINAAVAGHFNVPVLMISGDEAACSQAKELLGSLETVVVKKATSYFSAECLSPEITLPLLKATSRQAVLRLNNNSAPKPFLLSNPIKITIEFKHPESIDRVVRVPGFKWQEELKVDFFADDMLMALNGFRVAVKQSYD